MCGMPEGHGTAGAVTCPADKMCTGTKPEGKKCKATKPCGISSPRLPPGKHTLTRSQLPLVLAMHKLLAGGKECKNNVKQVAGASSSVEACAKAVTKDEVCGDLFERHRKYGRCSCMAPGVECDEQLDKEVDRFVLVRGGNAGPSCTCTITSTRVRAPPPPISSSVFPPNPSMPLLEDKCVVCPRAMARRAQ